MEVAEEHVLFLDNISICGNLPQISLHNRNLYVLGRVPKRFVNEDKNVSYPYTSSIIRASTKLAPYTLQIELSVSGDCLLFQEVGE